ncbi:acyl-CoA thioesterase [Pseudonocardia kunmingensis]|uniref:Acyl-CoA thioesterase-2 n=1 Tax=Pseudonocardia kunmingensis TaxID=630975 RepID=A0A543DPH1_9PSEU|nr:acyl-CoA thioesterase domain-containing protein [Pseudonocardia kunmingensis]TQM11208.1 acyl-CoA thioesterase-2 [Pseudonocardia kunmingensis]
MSTAIDPSATPAPDGTSLLELLELESLGRDHFLAGNVHVVDPTHLYGGQVGTQALRAATATVPADREAHSLHAYFLRRGDPARPIELRVERDRDGRSFSARRVVARQGDEVLLTMACSFAVPDDAPDHQAGPAPDVPAPEGLPVVAESHLASMELRLPPQPYSDGPYPTRVWARSQFPLPDDPAMHACVLTYVSDLYAGTAGFPGAADHVGSSIDHAVWFHRPVRMDDWVFMDLVPGTIARGRAWYEGTIHDRAGRLVASIAQETLFRRRC